MADKKINIRDIDFDNDYSGRKTCGIIGTFINARLNLDDLMATEFSEEDWCQTSAGCGNAEWYMTYPTQTHALAALASAFTGYHLQDYSSLYVGPKDYDLLREYAESTWIRNPSVQTAFDDFLRGFCCVYSDIDPKYDLHLIRGFD